MHHPFALIAAALLCLPPVAHAAAPATNATRRLQPERWLLIVDTSNAMERRAKAVEGVVGELIVSGMNGQMEPGAELGIWTYNKELFAGVAPMQTWDPARSNLMANRTVGFLSKQPYQSKSRTEPVIAELNRVVGDSRRLTVVWLSDGAGEKIAGTPFDDLINEAFAKYRPALSKTRMPLVTVLRVHHGKYIRQNVSMSPWPVEFPAFPIDPAKTNALAKPAVAKPAEPVKSIYISSPKKPDADKPAPVETQGGSVKLRPPPESVVADVVPPPRPADPPPVQPLPVVATEPPPVVAPVVAPVEPAPILKPAEPAPSPAVVEVAMAEPPPSVTAPGPAAPAVSTATPVVPEPQVAVVTNTVTARKWPLILGIGFMWAAIAAALLLARRARRASASSLITRSFDRDQK